MPFKIVGMAPVLAHITAGKLKALAVISKARVRWLPDVPAVSKSPGMDEFDITHWMGVQVQGKTPAEIIQRLYSEIAKSVQSADVQQALIAQGIEPVGNTPQEFAAFLDNERRRSTELIKIIGVRLNVSLRRRPPCAVWRAA